MDLPEHTLSIANALHAEKSSIVQIRGLNLSGNDSLVVDTAAATLKILILCKCNIGMTSDIKAILSACINRVIRFVIYGNKNLVLGLLSEIDHCL